MDPEGLVGTWVECREEVPLPAGNGSGKEKSAKMNLSLEMACFGEFWAVFFPCHRQKMLNFPPEVVIWWTLKMYILGSSEYAASVMDLVSFIFSASNSA